jgi:hypothetical protein
MKVWYCRNCGYEVDSRGRCHRCRQKLVASHLERLAPGPEDQEVGYRLDDWADRTRGRLIEGLVAGDVAHRFEGDELVVTVDDEERVDALVERVTSTAALDDLADGDEPDPALLGEVADGIDEEVTGALGLMLRAASRLRVDPTDMEADGEVAEASAGVFMVDGWAGADDDTWAAVGRVTRRLLAALGSDEALEEEIRTEAAVLATLLGPLVARSSGQTVTAPATNGSSAEVPGPPVPSGTDDLVAEDDVTRQDREAASAAAAALGLTWDDGDLDAPLVVDDPSAAVTPAAEPAAAEPAAAEPAAVEPAAAAEPAAVLGGGPETSYEAPDWLPDQRALLTVLLEERAIPHIWDGTDLVVTSADEDQVEALFDRIGGVAADEDDEARYRSIEELFAAVVRLVNDPDDEQRAADVVRTSVAVEGPTPLGFDDGAWLGLRRRTRTLADALEHKAHPDVIVSQATTLRDTLKAVV